MQLCFTDSEEQQRLVVTASDSIDEVTLEDLDTYSDNFESFTERSRFVESDRDFTPVSSIHTSIKTNSMAPVEKSTDRISKSVRLRPVLL